MDINLQHIAVIAVDYGGVVAHHYCEPYQSLLAEKLEVTIDTCKQLISEKSEQGKLFRIDEITRDDFWKKVESLAKPANKVSPTLLQLLWAKTYILDNRVLELLQVIRKKKKIKLCLFTNTDTSRFEYMIQTYSINEYFDITVCSFQTKFLKPSEESFKDLIIRCGQTNSPEDILFIDDRELAVNQAKNLGMSSLVYENYDQLVGFFLSSNILSKEDLL